MKKRVLSLFLALVMVLGMLPGTALASDPAQTTFDSFFAGLTEVCTVSNGTSYPFTVDSETEGGPWLVSGNAGKSSTRSTITLQMKQSATVSFEYKLSTTSSSGLEVKNGSKTLYTYSSYGSGDAVTGCNGTKSGTATIQAGEQDIITISYYRGYYSHTDDCMWLKNFAYTLPKQVTFHANNGTGETRNQGIFGTGALLKNPFAYDGHVFKGWAADENSTDIAYPDGGEITITEDTSLYAVWAPVYDLTFAVTPDAADFALYADDAHTRPIAENSGTRYVYTLENGTYHWAAGCFGYEPASGSATVNSGADSVSVALTARPVQTVTFAYGALIGGAAIENGTLEVKTGAAVMAAKAGTDGLIYKLPVGYDYAWTFQSANYARQTGSIPLSAATGAGSQSVTVPLAVKTAWEGAGDVRKPAQDAGGVYLIGSGAELAWLAQEVNAGRGTNYHAVLTRDIDLGGENWTPIGKAYSTRYSGVFDGQGFTVTGLSITASASGNYGLFGYVESGTVRNLTVEGAVSVTGSGSSSYGIAGIVGQFNGTTGAVENCVNKALVSGSQNVGGVIGYLTGGSSANDKAVRSCANLGNVSSMGAKAGGLIGHIYGPVTVENCYNTGSVSGGGWYHGGITAYLSSKNASVRNCYTTGTVTGSGAAPAIGKVDTGTAEKLYYLSGTGADANATAKTEAEMKSADFVTALGAAFQKDMPAPINGGYPILTFQDTTPKYEVTVTAAPADAAVTLTNAGEEVMPPLSSVGGVTTYRLPDGVYTCSISAFGYVTERRSVTVNGGADNVSVTLTPAGRRAVSFRVSPSEAAQLAGITVTYDGDGRTVAAESDGSYLLPTGGYHYVVKAKGYAKAEGALTVNGNESGTQVVNVTLQASTQWDGTSKDAVTPNSDGVYEIGSGAELAWFADQVNSGAGKTFNALLTDDIDLGGNLWTPIGATINYSTKEYAGRFDGGNFTVRGLNVQGNGNYVGLFGTVRGSSGQFAQVKNLTVEGTVSSTYGFLGGVVGTAEYADLENCHNRADVTCTGTSSKSYVGGVVGAIGNNSSKGSVVNCSNKGAVSGAFAEKIGGVVGYNNGAAVNSCYNSGAVSGKQNVGGVIGHAAGAVSNIYNTGAVTGQSGNVGGAVAYVAAKAGSLYSTGSVTNGKAVFGFVSTYSGEVSNSYYLSGLPADSNAQSKTSDELKNLVPTLNGGADPAAWKSLSALNDGYPVLVWQQVESGSGEGGALNKATNTVWRTNPDTGLLTGVATWDAVPNADSYTVVLWDYYTVEDEYGSSSGLKAIKTAQVRGTEHDFTADIEANGASWYYFTVTPIAAAGSGYESGTVPQTEADAYALIDLFSDAACYRYTAQLEMPTGLSWREHMAWWGYVDDAAGYLVVVYRLDDSDLPRYVAGGVVSGSVNTLDCRNYFAVGGRYVFSVSALSEEYLLSGVPDKNSPESKLSHDVTNGGTQYGIYVSEAVPDPDPDEVDRTDWVAISTAAQWMELANTEDVNQDPNDPSTNLQATFWAKKYYLTADLDFSGLSAVDQARTKSIGNINHRFTGVLDGNGHKIKGLTLSNHDSGLLAYIGSSGLVCNLTVEGANVLFSDNAAVLALNNYGTIRSCAVVNCNITADTGAVLGGLVSRNFGLVQRCYVQGGTLTSNSDRATGHAGFAGSNEAGGIIEQCWTSMDVHTQSDYAGGFVGLSYGGIIRDCFALGDVSARSYSGGFAGRSVYGGNTYQNCYAAGVVTLTEGQTGHGFIGGSKPNSAFQPDLSLEISNCYYNAASPADPHAAGKMLSEMQSSDFLIKLAGSGSGVWLQAADKNSGLPYLTHVPAPAGLPTTSITVDIALAAYNKQSYAFYQMGKTLSVTLQSNGNTRVIDVMDAAAAQGLLTYSYDTTPSFGRYIHTINGYCVEAPDGWMFTVNDQLSNVSASLATVTDGSRLLWFEGTTENRYLPPAWDSLAGETLQWIDIGSAEDLLKLAGSSDTGVLSKNYRLTADLDLSAVSAFPGIGSAAAPFTGVFDGQGHTVSHVTVSGAKNVGFFGVIKGATVKNLNLKHVSVTGDAQIGGLVGWAQVELDQENLADCVANLIGSCTVSGTVTGNSNVGGLVGLNDGAYDTHTLFSTSSAVDKCTSDVAVTASGSGSTNIGGLVGGNNGVITKSATLGTVSAADSALVGGFVGSSYGDIYDCHADGAVTGKNNVGSFGGSCSGLVKRCYSLGAVTGESYTGGFAGSISAADYVISAGRVFVTGSSTTGYNGGFAGHLSGQLTGIANQITVKDAYANCTRPDGGTLSAVGNGVDYQGEAQQEVLKAMALNSLAETSAQLYKMFGVNLPVPDSLQAEADKYADTVAAPQQIGSTLSLLKSHASAAEGIDVRYETESPYLTGGDTLTLVKANDSAATRSVPVVLVLSDTDGNVYRKPVTVLLPVLPAQRDSLMDAIARGYVDSSDGWTVMDMAVYASLPGKTFATTAEARQNALNLLISEAAGTAASVSDRARIEIVLRSMGIDSTRLYPVNSSTPFSNAKALSGMDLTSGGHYAAPWLLLADLQGNIKLTNDQTASLIQLLATNVGDGLFGFTWNGVTFSDPDTAGAALAALARFYDKNPDAKAVVDKILSALPGAMNETGSLGSANSDAMVILGLLALGKDPAQLTADTGASLIDGLLSYVNTTSLQFQYAGKDNPLATEQGFRALAAMAMANGGAYNVYDFSGKTAEPGRATGSGAVTPPETPDTDKTIQVLFSLKTDTEVWIPSTTLTVKQGSTVYHAFVQALAEAGDMSAVGAESGYVRSITKNGVTLSEFDKGDNSGWLYTVNGVLPNVGLTACPLSDGDSVLFYYTSDWKDDPNAGGSFVPSVPAPKLPFTDVEKHWALDAIEYVYVNKLMNGTAADRFDPDGLLSRAMLATILYRLEGRPAVSAASCCTDVPDGTWYTNAVIWASENGIVNGYGNGKFGPDDNVTREQMAAMLFRYARYKGYDVSKSNELTGFADAGSISSWALAALQWANAEQLVNGRSATAIVPNGSATRAETATILMRFCEKVAK